MLGQMLAGAAEVAAQCGYVTGGGGDGRTGS
jgi:hypothetical protein